MRVQNVGDNFRPPGMDIDGISILMDAGTVKNDSFIVREKSLVLQAG